MYFLGSIGAGAGVALLVVLVRWRHYFDGTRLERRIGAAAVLALLTGAFWAFTYSAAAVTTKPGLVPGSSLVITGGFAVSIALGAIGLYRVYRSWGPRDRETRLGIAVVACSAAAQAANLFGGQIVGLDSPAPVFTHTHDYTVRSAEELNYVLRTIPEGWSRLDASAVVDASLVYGRRNPDMWFAVLADELGSELLPDSQALSKLVRANFLVPAEGWQRVDAAIDAAELEIKGRDGIELTGRITRDGVMESHRIWAYVHNGFGYQLAAWSTEATELELASEHHKFLQSFDIVNSLRRARSASAADFNSTTFGYAVPASVGGWVEWPEVLTSVPEAEYGALNIDGQSLVVVPLALRDSTMPASDIHLALLTSVGIPYGAKSDVRETLALDAQTDTFVEHSQRFFRSPGVDRVARIVRRDTSAVLICAWAATGSGIGKNRLRHVVTLVEVGEDDNLRFDSLSLAQRHAQAQLYAALAEAFVDGESWEAALRYADVALFFEPSNLSALHLGAQSSLALGRSEKVLEMLESDVDLLLETHSLQILQAQAFAQLGQLAEAADAYQAAFDSGYRNEKDFEHLSNLLATVDRSGEALELIDSYYGPHPSLRIEILRASVQQRVGDFTGATSTLAKLEARYGWIAEVVLAQAELLLAHGRFRASLTKCKELLEAGEDSAHVYYLKACSEIGMKGYGAAMGSIDAALGLEPANEDYISLKAEIVELMRHRPVVIFEERA